MSASHYSASDGADYGWVCWTRRKDGAYDVLVRMANVISGNAHGRQYTILAGIAADDGFGNLVLIGGLE